MKLIEHLKKGTDQLMGKDPKLLEKAHAVSESTKAKLGGVKDVTVEQIEPLKEVAKVQASGFKEEAKDLKHRRHQRQLLEGVSHHRDGAGGVDIAAQVHLAEREHETRVHRQEQYEIQLAGPDLLGQMRAVDEEERLKDLLDEVTRAHQQDDLPFRPVEDVVRVLVDDGDEADLQGEPEKLHPNPQDEVRLERHLPGD